jgi:hypothetical protein
VPNRGCAHSLGVQLEMRCEVSVDIVCDGRVKRRIISMYVATSGYRPPICARVTVAMSGIDSGTNVVGLVVGDSSYAVTCNAV